MPRLYFGEELKSGSFQGQWCVVIHGGCSIAGIVSLGGRTSTTCLRKQGTYIMLSIMLSVMGSGIQLYMCRVAKQTTSSQRCPLSSLNYKVKSYSPTNIAE